MTETLAQPRRMPLSALTPSPYNAPSRQRAAPLAQLATSIKLHGVLQPILARPLPATDDGERFEIVAGERRWRASGIAGLADIPVLVKELTTLQALQLQAVENFQRQELLPLEEADAIDHLMRPPSDEQGMTVGQIAEALGRSEGHIRETHTLCALIPPARQALEAEQLSKSTALLIARMPVTIQPKALATLQAAQQRNGGQQLTHKAANELLQGKFMLRLKAAPFRPEDDTLVPDAGSCSACPKRTGANPDLFSDVPATDTCIDPDCYGTKVAADLDRRCNGARQMGQQVLRGDEALALLKMGPTSDELGGDYVYLDKPAPALTDEPGPLNTLLKGYTPTVLIVHPERNTLRPIATVDTVKRELASRNLLRQPKKPVGEKMSPATTKTAAGKKAQQAAANDEQRLRVEIERQVRIGIWRAISAATTPADKKQLPPGLIRALLERIAITFSSTLHGTELDLVCEEFCWTKGNFKGDPAPELRRLIAGLDDEDLDAIITLLLPIFDGEMTVSDSWQPSAQPETLLAIANSKEFARAVDVSAIRAEVTQAHTAAAKADTVAEKKAKKPAASKPAKKPGKAPTPNVSPPPAGESLRAREGNKKPKPASAAKAPKATQGNKDQAPTAQGNDGPTHWVGQFVRVKSDKGVLKVNEITSAGVLILHPVDVARPLPKQIRKLTSFDVDVLEGQVRPAEQLA